MVRGSLCALCVVVFASGQSFGQEDLDKLIRGLKSPVADERAAAATSIGKLGEKGKPASRALCEALLDKEKRVQVAVNEALEAVDKLSHRFAWDILQYQKSPIALAKSLDSICKQKEKAAPCISLLIRVRESWGKEQSGYLVVNALLQIAPDDEEAQAFLLRWLETEPEPTARGYCADGLGKGKGGEKVAAALLKAVKSDKDGSVRAKACKSLGIVGKLSKDVEEALKEAKVDEYPDVRAAATEALKKLKGEN